MGRYIRDFMIKTDPQPVLAAVFNYLQSEGYEYTELNGEKVYKKGNKDMRKAAARNVFKKRKVN